jgi:threonine dehydrogenase-like Zn-dependent dehydrogenase
MRGAILYGPHDVREAAKIVEPIDAILRVSLTCVRGSDLWPCRGFLPSTGPRRWSTRTAASS